MSKLCKDAGFLKKIEKRQFFITIEDGSEVMQIACREYTHTRNLTTSRPRGWIRSNPKVGPVLDVKLCPHEGRYCIDIMIDSLFTDRTVSSVRIVNDINKHVTAQKRQKKYPLRTLISSSAQGNLWQGPSQDHSITVVLKCQNS